MISKRPIKLTKIFDNSVTNSSRNKNKQKTATKKSNMVSNAMNDMADLDGESDSRNCNEIVENGGIQSVDGVGTRENECLDADSDKSECDRSRNMGINRSNEGDKKDTEQRGNDYEDTKGINGNSERTYAKMVTTDMKIVNNKLDFIPTEISEEGGDIVIFDEAFVEKDSAQ
ncbi:hypothetical protein Tco_1038268 [Tanacetum coccineum]